MAFDCITAKKTVEELQNLIGFKIDKILEPIPDEKAIKIIPKYINQYDRPYFLFIRAKK